MIESTCFFPGSICWIDVPTTDPPGSQDFYAGLFGWTYRVSANPHGKLGTGEYYATALLDGRPVAGLASSAAATRQPPTRQPPTRQPPARRPAGWRLYLSCANVAYTAEMLGRWGGRVRYGPAATRGQGRILLGNDPTGAEVGFWQLPTNWAFRTATPGSLVWADLHTWDGPRANKFYASLFGYRQQQLGGGIDYTTWSLGDYRMLGRLQMDRYWSSTTPAHWMLYLAVDPETGTDQAVDRVLALGGELHVDPVDSEFGRTAVVQDPSGAIFSLVDPTRRLPREVGVTANDDPYDD